MSSKLVLSLSAFVLNKFLGFQPLELSVEATGGLIATSCLTHPQPWDIFLEQEAHCHHVVGATFMFLLADVTSLRLFHSSYTSFPFFLVSSLHLKELVLFVAQFLSLCP